MTSQIRALIFDFDGVLVDLEPLHCRAWQTVAAPSGHSFSGEKYNQEYLGLNDRDIAKKLSLADVPKAIRQKEKESRKLLAGGVPKIPGAEEFLKKAKGAYPMGIVTGALPGEVFRVLKMLEWEGYFEFVITADDVKKGKPDPEGYLKAFEKMRTLKKWDPSLKKEECLIFEDSQYGIMAAQNAGIPFVHVKGSFKSIPRY